MSVLPTGSCQYRLLDQAHTCGCQRFLTRRRRHVDDDEDPTDQECYCGHHSCFHKLEATPPPSFVYARLPALEDTEAAKRITSQAGAGHHEGGYRRPTPSFSPVSGTTTERDPSTSATPQATFLKPAFPSTAHTRTEPPRSVGGAADAGALQIIGGSAARGRTGSSVSSTISTKAELQSVKNTLKTLIEATKELRNDTLLHGNRIETIENLPSALEELSEKIETLDDRIDERYVDFEGRLEEQMQARFAEVDSYIREQQEKKKRRRQMREEAAVEGLDGHGDPKRRKKHGNEPSSNCSSFTSTASSFDEVEYLRGQLKQLKNRVMDIEKSAAPTVNRTWDIEVVLIPPSPNVRGAWRDTGASAASTQTTNELGPASPPIFNYPVHHSGMMPRTFSPKSVPYRRLYSRGFIRQVSVAGPSAREVSMAIETTFKHLFDWFHSIQSSTSKNSSQSSNSSQDSQRTVRPPKIRMAWMPLRKIYHQTTLEYLPKAELAIPALWTVDYLKAYCMMKATDRRVLFIMPTVRADIGWDDIYRLDRYYDHNLAGNIGEPGEDPEKCWEFDEKIDTKPSRLESFTSMNFTSYPPEKSLCSSDDGSTPRQQHYGPPLAPAAIQAKQELEEGYEPTQCDEPTQPDEPAASHPEVEYPPVTPPETAAATPQTARPRKRTKTAPARSTNVRRSTRAKSAEPRTTRKRSESKRGTSTSRPISPPSTLPAVPPGRRRLRSYKSPSASKASLSPINERKERSGNSPVAEESVQPATFPRGGLTQIEQSQTGESWHPEAEREEEDDDEEKEDPETIITNSSRMATEEREDQAQWLALFQSMQQEENQREQETDRDTQCGKEGETQGSAVPTRLTRGTSALTGGDSGDGGYISE